ncbi:radical SAM family heme chaperone HemW [Aurantibacter aestuarii]|uniref:Heme chaperone HemW n=1 Tax=Aurantibacter aestuarii TaxID=1266046 RepID=A0A2T1NBZ0_9FLAO|nr:radical SAM family heme chaperone HemW [Aurantibacter aestuarii]PSG89952.1 coproporphyrinogen III oxidase [Aurantibacter aestuarii]
MSGIYIHIPFCKQACHYCDFHFSTSLNKKDELISALKKEIRLRKDEFKSETVETIYFGGGTPSLLTNLELESIIQSVYETYKVAEFPEITLEANPDDLSKERLIELSKSPINRLSIGIQSFFEADLKLMNRAHNSEESKKCIAEAVNYFDNISIDLIYGVPNATNEQWIENIETALSFGVPHISSYALTVEPKTALASMIKQGKIDNVDDEKAQEQFYILKETLEKADFEHYELSNFAKKGYYSKNNSAYWLGKKYIGIGPSAHSFNGKQRSWNISNNIKYIKALQEDHLPCDIETLSDTDRYNEYIMTGLRTIWGVNLNRVEKEFGKENLNYLLAQATPYITQELLYIEASTLKTTRKGQFLSDGIASELFKLN